LEKRTLGRTGHQSTVITFGAAGAGRAAQEDTDRAMELLLEHGVNHIDIAPTYGEALERLRPWMAKIRDQVFLGSKTNQYQTRETAWADIRQCQERLGVETYDLFQLHGGGTTMGHLDAATAPGGGLEALVEMREQGLTRWIGITGHGPDAPRVQLEALERFDFDTIQFPLSATLWQDPNYRRDAERLLQVAAERNVGIQTIKMLVQGRWTEGEQDLDTWYEPLRDPADISRAIAWLIEQPIHTAPTSGDLTLLPHILAAAEKHPDLDPADIESAAARLPAAPADSIAWPGLHRFQEN
jgi:aryl-alcohol dehydrogenase-like predicted oxidoreductase